jgi:hypothetical protein
LGDEPFSCDDGSEILRGRICDRIADCADGEDEDPEACLELDETPAPCRTSPGRYNTVHICNGVNDCADGTDEVGCETLFECQGFARYVDDPPFKVRAKDYCSGAINCSRGEDEPDGCAEPTARTCD